MIPKLIHYCWLSNDPIPEKLQKCINSWKEKLPEYEIMLWDFNRFDIHSSIWVKQAFEAKKYAFAADYIRLYAVYHYGGIYLDSDVEVVKPLNDLLHLPYFIGLDSNNLIEAGIIGSEKNNPWIKACLDYYQNRSFIKDDGTNDVEVLPVIMKKEIEKIRTIVSLKETPATYDEEEKYLYVFPFPYFCSKRHDTGKVVICTSTYTVHHFAMSWLPVKVRILTYSKRAMMKIFGVKFIERIISSLSLKELKSKLINK